MRTAEDEQVKTRYSDRHFDYSSVELRAIITLLHRRVSFASDNTIVLACCHAINSNPKIVPNIECEGRNTISRFIFCEILFVHENDDTGLCSTPYFHHNRDLVGETWASHQSPCFSDEAPHD